MRAARIRRVRPAPGRPRALGLRVHQGGQAAVEYMLMMVVTLLVVLMVISVAFLGNDLLTTRYASFVGARGYLCRDPLWPDGCEQVGGMVVNNTGNMWGRPVGDGVRFTVEVKEFFPLRTLFGDSGRTFLERETLLGPPEPPMSGDNQAQYAPGG